MSDLEKIVKECILILTNTLSENDFYCVDFAGVENIQLNIQDSTKLIDLIESFNKLYISFKKEYDNLEKIKLGENVQVLSFKKFYHSYEKQNCRDVILNVYKPTFTNHDFTTLFLREADGEIKPFFSNCINPCDKNYYKENVTIDKEFAKRYLDLFEKYELLIKAVNLLGHWEIFGDGLNYLAVEIDNRNKNLLNGLNKLKIILGHHLYNIHIVINLGENFGIDYNNCKITYKEKEKENNPTDFDYVLNNLWINKQYVRKR